MRSIAVKFVVLFFLSGTSFLQGQNYALKAGGIAKFSDFYISSRLSDNFVVGPALHVEYQFSYKWTINVGVDYTHAEASDYDSSFSSPSVYGKRNTFSVLPEVRFYFSESFNGPFVGGRAGFNIYEVEYIDDFETVSYNELSGLFGIALGTVFLINDKIPIELRIGGGIDTWDGFDNFENGLVIDLGISAGYLFSSKNKEKDVWD